MQPVTLVATVDADGKFVSAHAHHTVSKEEYQRKCYTPVEECLDSIFFRAGQRTEIAARDGHPQDTLGNRSPPRTSINPVTMVPIESEMDEFLLPEVPFGRASDHRGVRATFWLGVGEEQQPL